MFSYLLLLNPGHSRVYFDAAKDISINELKILLNSHIIADSVKAVSIANVEYLSFESASGLSRETLNTLARMSSFYALFEQMDDKAIPGNALIPIDCGDWRFFPDSLNTILKYTGKTNEQFTRLMVNIAAALCAKPAQGKRLHLLDPLSGKGTTLFEGVIQGFDITGIEIAPKSAEECETFFVKFLENGRYKHKASKETRTANGKKIAGLRQVEFAHNKEVFTSGNTQHFRLFNGDSALLGQYIKKQSVDFTVMDLPYGVQHASTSAAGKSRSAESLLDGLIPSIAVAMKSGGPVVMSFNTFTTKKDRIKGILTQNGFKAADETAFGSFAHKVDQAINRDIVIAFKA